VPFVALFFIENSPEKNFAEQRSSGPNFQFFYFLQGTSCPLAQKFRGNPRKTLSSLNPNNINQNIKYIMVTRQRVNRDILTFVFL